MKILEEIDVYNNHTVETFQLKQTFNSIFFSCHYLLFMLDKIMYCSIKFQICHPLKKIYFKQKLFTMHYKNTAKVIRLKMNESHKLAIT